MRKIEALMLQALKSGQSWSQDNTSVYPDGSVYLHGNRIAHREQTNTGSELVVDLDTLRRWPTNTTRSRLRALGFNVKGSQVLA